MSLKKENGLYRLSLMFEMEWRCVVVTRFRFRDSRLLTASLLVPKVGTCTLQVELSGHKMVLCH